MNDLLLQTVRDAYNAITHKQLSPSDAERFVEGLMAYDGLYDEFLKNPQSVTQSVFSTSLTGHLFIPCYTVELRNILRSKILVSSYNIIGFTLETAKQFLHQYPVLLVFDLNKLECDNLKSICILDKEVHFDGALVRVLALGRGDTLAVENVKDIATEAKVDFGVITDLPGISTPKVAQNNALKNAPLQKFIVNLPTMDISEHVNSVNAKSALQEVLDRKWRETGNPHKNPEFTAEYWLNSPMMSSEMLQQMVRKAEKSGKTITAAEEMIKNPQQPTETIKLTPQEEKIFSFLMRVNQENNLGLTLRAVGGWTRDKLLGSDSDDIDIALDKMTGAQFAPYVEKASGRKSSIIQSNPDKSKHLETVTMNVEGTDVDFVNLRSETYGDTRVPEMQFGTPEQDASRRDLTVNALFYNLNTGQIEDFTGKGLEDLKTKTLRTPLDPVQTFKDDPLRILRTLRFYSKMKGSTIAPEVLQAMADPKVQDALDPKNVNEKGERKISEERILTEWQKTLKGPQASKALRVLHDTGIWNRVFVGGAKQEGENQKDFSKFHPFTMDQNNQHHYDNVLDHTLKVVELYDEILRADGAGDDERSQMLAAAFMHDLGKLDPSIIGEKEVEGVIRNNYHGHEDVSAIAARAILQGIKASNEEIELIEKICKEHMWPHSHTDQITDKTINKKIRNLGKNLVRRIIQHAKADAMSKPGADQTHYDNLLNRVQNSVAVEPKMVRPVVNGGIIMQMFPGFDPKSGFIKEIQDHLQDIRDGNPQFTEQQGLAEVENMRQMIEQKYKDFVPQKKTVKPQMPKPAPKTSMFNLSEQIKAERDARRVSRQSDIIENLKTAADNSTARLLCGKVVKHPFGTDTKSEHEAVFLVTDEGEYKLRRAKAANPFEDQELDDLVGKRICGKGMIHEYLFIVSEYNIVNLDKDQETVEMKRESLEEATPFKEGDKVRHRHRGLAFSQITGRVAKIDKDLMYVKWEGISELEVFPLEDAVAIFGILQKI